MDSLKMHTPDLANENYRKLAEMFPNAVTETIDENGEVVRAIDADVLRQEISATVVEGPRERYQFNWPDKKKSVVLANQPIAKTLRLDREKSVGRDGTPGSIDTENIYIEGDNLDALKLLQETYLGKVKMIYIDPPYNTGSDSFVYDDDSSISEEEFSERSGQRDDDGNLMFDMRINNETNGKFHTDWLNMLYPRLRLAKDLLSEDGIIFISIDDHELENMKKICNEIFGEENQAATFLWTKTSTPPALSYKCRRTVEYVLTYEKNLGDLKYYGSDLDGGDAPFLNTGNPRKILLFPAGSMHFNFIEEGIIPAGEKSKVQVLDDIIVKGGLNSNDVHINGEFKWEQDTLYNEIESGTYFIVKTDKFSIRFQRMNQEAAYKTPNNFLNIELNKGNGVDTNENAIKELEKIGLSRCFDYPKPSTLIKYLINMICKNDQYATVLDFFSGSGTTAQAVMQLNEEDGGQRKYILVQLPEKCDIESDAYKMGFRNICEIGEERIRRSGINIKEDSLKRGGNIDIGFRVFHVDDTNMKDVYYRPADYSQGQLEIFSDNIKPDRTPEDLLFQVMLDLGVLLSSKIKETEIEGKHIFSVADGYLIACFDSDITDDVVTAIAKQHPFYAVFRDSGIASDSVMTNFEQIFETYSPKTQRKVL